MPREWWAKTCNISGWVNFKLLRNGFFLSLTGKDERGRAVMTRGSTLSSTVVAFATSRTTKGNVYRVGGIGMDPSPASGVRLVP